MSDKTELLPCPFCGPKADEGSRVVLLAERESDGYVRGYTVRCDHCGIELHDEYESDVTAAWNRRSSVQEAAPATAADGLADAAIRLLSDARYFARRWSGPKAVADYIDEQMACRGISAARAVAPAGVPEGSPDDIRAAGWAVAVHNDYRLHGQPHTFWLFTKGDRAVKGEGLTDAEALNEVRRSIGLLSAAPAAPSAGEANKP